MKHPGPRAANAIRAQVGLEQSYKNFVGLNEKEKKRIVVRGLRLLHFVLSFDLFDKTFNAESSLQVL
jgi:hypothetical protein